MSTKQEIQDDLDFDKLSDIEKDVFETLKKKELKIQAFFKAHTINKEDKVSNSTNKFKDLFPYESNY